LIFCYDGEPRPRTKWGKNVLPGAHWMTRPTQHILNAFNIQWVIAPGEAEAQLALMNKDGMINAVMTDDSDAFIFGAPAVLR
ncbi:PIN domain-like protein, partial [Melanogaster broomeanus]